jgi:hypothetical protein
VLTLFLFIYLSEAFLTSLRAGEHGMGRPRIRRVNLRVKSEEDHVLAWRALKVYRIRTRKGWESAYEVYEVLRNEEELDKGLARLAQFDSVGWDDEAKVWRMKHGHVEVEVRCGEGGECEATITVNALAVLFSAVEDLMHKVSILEEKLRDKE